MNSFFFPCRFSRLFLSFHFRYSLPINYILFVLVKEQILRSKVPSGLLEDIAASSMGDLRYVCACVWTYTRNIITIIYCERWLCARKELSHDKLRLYVSACACFPLPPKWSSHKNSVSDYMIFYCSAISFIENSILGIQLFNFNSW